MDIGTAGSLFFRAPRGGELSACRFGILCIHGTQTERHAPRTNCPPGDTSLPPAIFGSIGKKRFAWLRFGAGLRGCFCKESTKIVVFFEGKSVGIHPRRLYFRDRCSILMRYVLTGVRGRIRCVKCWLKSFEVNYGKSKDCNCR